MWRGTRWSHPDGGNGYFRHHFGHNLNYFRPSARGSYNLILLPCGLLKGSLIPSQSSVIQPSHGKRHASHVILSYRTARWVPCHCWLCFQSRILCALPLSQVIVQSIASGDASDGRSDDVAIHERLGEGVYEILDIITEDASHFRSFNPLTSQGAEKHIARCRAVHFILALALKSFSLEYKSTTPKVDAIYELSAKV